MTQATGERGAPADLEIHVRAAEGEAEGWRVDLVLDHSQHFGPVQLARELPRLGPEMLPAEAGAALHGWLMAGGEMARGWAEARGQAESGGRSPLRRIRLWLDAEAPDLHALPWELLAEPDHPGAPWAASEATPFSRYLGLSSPPGHPVFERPARLLVAIAAPGDARQWGLPELDAEAEWQAISQVLAEVGPELLSFERLEAPVTLDRLAERLAGGGCHLLHLLAHGRVMPEDGPIVYLENEAGGTQAIRAEQLAACLQRAGGGLRLLFLASCEGATESPAAAFSSLARQAIEAGVPAVVAFAESVTVPTARAFAGAFYRALLADGRVDHAANRARAALMDADRPASRPPVLFSRLTEGRLFWTPGEVVSEEYPDVEEFWSYLLDYLAEGDCMPILGPRILTDLLPSAEEVARELAALRRYPFAGEHRLSQVAQWVSLRAGKQDVERHRRDVLRILAKGFARRHGLPPEDAEDADFARLVAGCGWSQRVRGGNESEIHHLLADLPIALYLTTNWDGFLGLALASRGRPAVEEGRVRWDEPEPTARVEQGLDFAVSPTVEQPVVFHFFGDAREPRSLLLSEDDAFDYLVRVGRDLERLVPATVREALAAKTLLFLGYEFGDPGLHLLLRGLLLHPSVRRNQLLRVAVQVDPGLAGHQEVDAARDYVDRYFGRAEISVYWGSTRKFVAELHERFHRRARG